MKTTQWIVLIVVLLLLNNFLLVKNLDYFYPSLKTSEVAASTASSQGAMQRVYPGELDREIRLEPIGESQIIEPAITQGAEYQPAEDQTSDDHSFQSSFKTFSQSQEFLNIMDQYTMASGQRMMEKMQRYGTMSAQELYQAFIDAESLTDQQLALQGLWQGKLGELETSQIKDLYQASSGDLFGSSQALKLLLERDDPDAIRWAREAVNQPATMMMGGHDLLPLLYEKDPEFVTDYVNNISVDDINGNQFLTFGFIQEPELQKLYFENNLDAILDSENSSVFQMAPYNIDLDLDRSQQNKVVGLLSAANREKRQFGLALIGKVADAQLLREGYANLTRSQDRQSMISTLLADGTNSEHRQLVIELAASSEDPQIRRLVDGLQ